jgi:hypothetical protein
MTRLHPSLDKCCEVTLVTTHTNPMLVNSLYSHTIDYLLCHEENHMLVLGLGATVNSVNYGN